MRRRIEFSDPDDSGAPNVPYVVSFTDVAKAEAEAAYLWLLPRTGDAFALRWYAGVFAEAEKLTSHPLRGAIAPEDDRFNVTVRYLLYRQGRVAYRLLYHVVEPQRGDEFGTIYILHVRHAARLPIGEAPNSDNV